MTYNYWHTCSGDAWDVSNHLDPQGQVDADNEDDATSAASALIRDGYKDSPNVSELETLSIFVAKS